MVAKRTCSARSPSMPVRRVALSRGAGRGVRRRRSCGLRPVGKPPVLVKLTGPEIRPAIGAGIAAWSGEAEVALECRAGPRRRDPRSVFERLAGAADAGEDVHPASPDGGESSSGGSG